MTAKKKRYCEWCEKEIVRSGNALVRWVTAETKSYYCTADPNKERCQHSPKG